MLCVCNAGIIEIVLALKDSNTALINNGMDIDIALDPKKEFFK